MFSEEKGIRGLYFLPINKKMNAELYLKVLREHMLNFSTFMGLKCLCMIVHPVLKPER